MYIYNWDIIVTIENSSKFSKITNSIFIWQAYYFSLLSFLISHVPTFGPGPFYITYDIRRDSCHALVINCL